MMAKVMRPQKVKAVHDYGEDALSHNIASEGRNEYVNLMEHDAIHVCLLCPCRYLYTLEKSLFCSSGIFSTMSAYIFSAVKPSGSGLLATRPISVANPMSWSRLVNPSSKNQETKCVP